MDLYVILGLEQGASLREIERAYRRLARKYHPDINPGDAAAAAIFGQVLEAYETLSDPERRRRYDVGAPAAERSTPAAYQFQGFDFSRRSGDEPTFGDLFADVFRRPDARWPAGRPEHGADLHTKVSLCFEAALRGGEHHVMVLRRERCPSCQGAGELQSADAPCSHCRGTGNVRWARGHMVFAKSCPICEGSGRLRSRPCGVCAREGVVTRTESVPVVVPAGVRDEARLRVPGKGHVGWRGGAPGDLYVTVQVEGHPLFRREEDDLLMVVPIAVHEAALGARIDLPTVDGPLKLRIPPGTQSAQRFRLRGRGAPTGRGDERGDLIVEVRLVLPGLIDERSKELLREFARLHPEDVRGGLWNT